MSRAAAWSLLTFSRRHPIVFETVAASCVPLAPWFVDASVRAEEVAPGLGSAAAGGGSGSGGGGEEGGVALSEGEANARLEVLPALLHLMASMRAQGRAAEAEEAAAAAAAAPA